MWFKYDAYPEFIGQVIRAETALRHGVEAIYRAEDKAKVDDMEAVRPLAFLDVATSRGRGERWRVVIDGRTHADCASRTGAFDVVRKHYGIAPNVVSQTV